jgi:radical SAM protein with 4Fe4S-binding SPASM domain
MKLNLSDSLLYISKLNFRKGINAIKVLLSYYISKLLKRPILWGQPISISIEPTTSCNLRCPECPSGLRNFTRPTGMLSLDFYKKIIEEIDKDTLSITFYFQGEPFLNPDFLSMIRIAAAKKMHVSTSTNAHFINDDSARQIVESGLDRLIISIDGTAQETYEQYRVGGNLKKVIDATEHLIHWKNKLQSKTPHLIFQFLVVKPNEHQIQDIETLGKRLKVDEIRFKTAQIYNYEQGNPLIPSIDKYSRYKRKKDGSYVLKNKLPNQCWKMWHSTVITWDGKILPCCFDKDAKHQLGNLQSSPFKTIWESNEYNQFRASILKSRSQIDICQNCSEGTKVWA